VAVTADVETATEDAVVFGSLISLAELMAASDGAADPLLQTDMDSSSTGVCITTFKQHN